jgi:hypothetical protein
VGAVTASGMNTRMGIDIFLFSCRKIQHMIPAFITIAQYYVVSRMTGNLLDSLVTKCQRETAGSSTAARFDYQKNWAFCQMIDRHQENIDYLVAFEFHDDVLFFDAEVSPTQIEFFQVKTTRSVKPRTLASLTQKNGDANSIVGKMITNADGLTTVHRIKFILVSNNAYEFSSVNVCAGQLDDKFKAKLLSKINEEFSDYEETHLESLFFWVSDIPVDGIETFLRGKAMELFEERFGNDFLYNVATWLRLVQGEIIRKNNFPPEEIDTIEKLISKKCIGKSFIDGTLNEISKRHKSSADIAPIKIRLSEAGWSDIALMRFDKALASAVADSNDPTNKECNTLQKNISDGLKNYDLNSMNVAQILEAVFNDLTEASLVPPPYRNKEYICALTVLVIHEEL